MVDENILKEERRRLKNALEKSGADSVDDLVDWANNQAMTGYMHDAFIHGVGAAKDLLLEGKDMNQVYHERNIAFLGMMKTLKKTEMHSPMGWYNDDNSTDEWVVVWCRLPTGEVSRHIPRSLISDIDWIENQPDSFKENPYSTEENNERLKAFIEGE